MGSLKKIKAFPVFYKVNKNLETESLVFHESLIRYSPVLVVANKNIIQNPIPKNINSNIWNVCYDYQELINNLSFLEEYLLKSNLVSSK